MAVRTPIKHRFWKHVEKSDGCWVWKSILHRQGYGVIHECRDGRYIPKKLLAHRVSWELSNGKKIPKGMHVLHKCDNPPCVRPDHLFIGTHLDNMRDKVAKGRHSYKSINVGSEHPLSLLNEAKVKKILAQYATGKYSQYDLAEMHGVSRSCIQSVVNRTRWTHI